MKKVLVVALSVASIVGAVQIAGRALHPKAEHVLVADGSDPMPLCKLPKSQCPMVGSKK